MRFLNTPRLHRIAVVSVGIFVLGAIYLRLLTITESLWTDEVWVANSILQPSLREMFFYDRWAQTTPVAFLMLERWIAGALGPSNLTFRIWPLVAGIASIGLVWLAGRQILRRPYDLIPVLLVAGSPIAIFYSRFLKQYSSELAAAALILYLAILYLKRPNTARYCGLLGGVLFSQLLSHPTVTFVPGALFIIAFPWMQERITGRLTSHGPGTRTLLVRLIIFCLAHLTVFGINYVVYAQPNNTELLVKFWGLKTFYRDCESILCLLKNLYRPLHDVVTLTAISNFGLPPVGLQGARWLILVCILLTAACVGLSLKRAISGSMRHVMIFPLAALPMALAVVLGIFGLYPVRLARMVLFLVPSAALLVAYALQSLTLGARAKNLISGQTAQLVAFCTVFLASLPFFFYGVHTIPQHPIEDFEGVTRYLMETAKQEDRVYLHASVREGIEFYGKVYSWSGVPVVAGMTGWPCCPRQGSTESEPEELAREAEWITEGSPSRIWLVYTGRLAGNWGVAQKQSGEWLASEVQSHGYSENPTPDFQAVVVRLFSGPAVLGPVRGPD